MPIWIEIDSYSLMHMWLLSFASTALNSQSIGLIAFRCVVLIPMWSRAVGSRSPNFKKVQNSPSRDFFDAPGPMNHSVSYIALLVSAIPSPL